MKHLKLFESFTQTVYYEWHKPALDIIQDRMLNISDVDSVGLYNNLDGNIRLDINRFIAPFSEVDADDIRSMINELASMGVYPCAAIDVSISTTPGIGNYSTAYNFRDGNFDRINKHFIKSIQTKNIKSLSVTFEKKV